MSIIVFLLVFSVIVTIHEFGHYYIAKKSGVLVREFALGMGPKMATWKKGETTFTIRALPLGGFVRMAGADDEVAPIEQNQTIYITRNTLGQVVVIDTRDTLIQEDAEKFLVETCDLVDTLRLSGSFEGSEDVVELIVDDKALLIEKDGTSIQVAPRHVHLESATVWQRIAIYVAGPVCNFLLSIVVFMFLAFASNGVPSASNHVAVVDNGPAQRAGVKTGDQIVSINQQETTSYQAIVTVLNKAKTQGNNVVLLEVVTNGVNRHISVNLEDWKLGVYQTLDTRLETKLTYGFTQTIAVVQQVWQALVNLVTSGFKMNSVGGPLAIVQASGQVAQAGILQVLAFLAMISANLGVMNLLPIPALDGGKILLGFIEVLRGKPISKEKEMMVTMVGAILLIALTVAVTFNDITRLLSGR